MGQLVDSIDARLLDLAANPFPFVSGHANHAPLLPLHRAGDPHALLALRHLLPGLPRPRRTQNRQAAGMSVYY